MRLLVPAVLSLVAVAPPRADQFVRVAGGGTAESDALAAECALRELFAVEFRRRW
jgi:hypothetical protein